MYERNEDQKARRKRDYGIEPDEQLDIFGDVAEEHPQTRHYNFSPDAHKARKKGQLMAHHIDFDPYDEKTTGTKMTMLAARLFEIRSRADVDDVSSLYDCLSEYLQVCAEWNVRPSNMNLYLACGVTKEMVGDWANGRSRRDKPEYRDFAMTVKAICSGVRNQLAIENKINPVLAIWWDKTIDGIYDQPDALQEDNTPRLGELLTPKELEEKYDDLPDD